MATRYYNLENEAKAYLKTCNDRGIVNQTSTKILNDYIIARKNNNQDASFLARNPIALNGLALWLDAGIGDLNFRNGTLFYRWFTTNGSNPTTKAGFDAFFNVTPQGWGFDNNREVNWLTNETRPSYITQASSYAWEVAGFLFVSETGGYRFSITSDDGNELQINGSVVASFYGGRGVGPEDVSPIINLGAGYHTFQYRMQQGGGGAGARVRWQRPSSAIYEVIPSSNFAVRLIPDLSGNNNAGLLTNSVGYNTVNGGTLVLNGSNAYSSIGTNGFPFGSSPGTLSGWARTNTISGGTNWIISYGTPNLLLSRYIGILNNQYFFGGFAGGNIVASGVQLNTWFNMVGVYDGVNSSMYINGALVAGPTPVSFNTIPSNASVGTQTNGGEYWNGSIANVQIYNRALTPQEILQNYNAQRSRFGL
jgi:hypothetical protein